MTAAFMFAAISALCALVSFAAAFVAARYWRYARRTRDQIANSQARFNVSFGVSSEQLRREIVRLQREGKLGGGR